MSIPMINTDAGVDNDWSIALTDPQGSVAGYTTADTPSAVVWAGDDAPVLFAPAVSWVDPALGTLLLTLSALDTAALDPATYYLRVTIATFTGRTIVAWDGRLRVDPSPGAAATSSAYCTHADLLTYHPDLDRHQRATDQAGFYGQRREAREWLDTIIVNHSTGTYATAVLGGSGGFNPSTGLWFGRSYRNQYMQTLLDQDLLKVTRQVKEITARRAIGLVLTNAQGPTKDDTSYQVLGRRFLADSCELVKSYIAEVNPNDQGYPAFSVPCGSINTRGL